MKRLALLLAATAACVLFTACEKQEPVNGYYAENITYCVRTDTVKYDYFTQEFTLKDGKMIYDPCNEANLRNGYIDFEHYCNLGTMPFVEIKSDTVVYDVEFNIAWLNMMTAQPFKGRINKTKKGFTFSYGEGKASAYSYRIEVTHECYKIKSLSD